MSCVLVAMLNPTFNIMVPRSPRRQGDHESENTGMYYTRGACGGLYSITTGSGTVLVRGHPTRVKISQTHDLKAPSRPVILRPPHADARHIRSYAVHDVPRRCVRRERIEHDASEVGRGVVRDHTELLDKPVAVGTCFQREGKLFERYGAGVLIPSGDFTSPGIPQYMYSGGECSNPIAPIDWV